MKKIITLAMSLFIIAQLSGCTIFEEENSSQLPIEFEEESFYEEELELEDKFFEDMLK